MKILSYLNLCLLILFPIAWFALLIGAGRDGVISILDEQRHHDGHFGTSRTGSVVYP